MALRHDSDLIKLGDFDLLDPDDVDVFAYKRHYNGQTLLVISNFTNSAVTRDYGQQQADTLLISNYDDDQGSVLRPYESKVYQFNH
ncbi:alpha-glucosidase C-terminal domain-containing protein [Secundilactobacillus paracollinoides]|uniref:alpha-glucosidase C-terminal domain-containing protein n=1 Tax=Secundilactobacillus paracollinoides TaxID=240427 RepID=UPI003F7398B2